MKSKNETIKQEVWEEVAHKFGYKTFDEMLTDERNFLKKQASEETLYCMEKFDEGFDEAISKTRAKCIKEAGFKDADEEIARLQEKHQQELENAVRRAKLDSMEFHTKHMNELLARNNSDNLRIFNKMKEDLKQGTRQQTISEVGDWMHSCVRNKEILKTFEKKFGSDEHE